MAHDLAGQLQDLTGSGHHLGSGSYYGKGIWADDRSWCVLYAGQAQARGTVALTLRQTVTEALPLPAVLRLAGATRASRLDLSTDDHDWRARPRDLFHGLVTDTIRSKVQKRHRRLSFHGDGLTGLEMGAPTSDRRVRMYDKPENGSVRTEVQLRRDLAADAFELLRHGWSPAAVWWHEVRQAGTFDALPGFAHVVSDALERPATPRDASESGQRPGTPVTGPVGLR